ncbi:hypothetical protein HKX48_005118 [Thoreauomyces humboldtii]|nr:hypothetical protein HKX48_005118 [Thoreauomyces humboldtii]
MGSPAEPTFGRTLWDQWEQVETYTRIGTTSLEKFNDFLKRRSEIEAEYAKALQKLVKLQKDEAVAARPKEKGGFGMAVMSGTVSQSWLQLLTVTEHTAAFHTTLSEQLDGEMRKSIKTQIKDNDKIFKQQFDEIRKQTLEYRKAVDTLEKTRLKYDKATGDMDAARQMYEGANQNMNKTAKDIEKLRSDAEKKAIIAQDAATGYKQCIGRYMLVSALNPAEMLTISAEQTNVAKERFYEETLPTLLDDIQSKDETARIDFTRKAFLRYADLLNAQTPSITSSIEAMVSIFDKISPQYDSGTFVKLCKTNAAYPPDFTFEERALTSAGGAGPQRKSLVRGFTKSSLEVDENKEDAILTMPASKSSRKKAVERVKLLDRELSECEKKRQGCETLISVYATKPEISHDPKVARDLDDQIKAIDARVSYVTGKKQKLMAYIAQMDGTPMPDGMPGNPSPLTPFTPDSPTTASFRSIDSALIPTNDFEPSDPYGHPSGVEETAPSQSLGRARMIYDYEGAPGDLSVVAGEEIEVLEKQDDGWWKARVDRAEGPVEGFIPGYHDAPFFVTVLKTH